MSGRVISAKSAEAIKQRMRDVVDAWAEAVNADPSILTTVDAAESLKSMLLGDRGVIAGLDVPEATRRELYRRLNAAYNERRETR